MGIADHDEYHTLLLTEEEEYTLPLDDLKKRLKTDLINGLTQKEAEKRLTVFGPNTIPKIKPSIYQLYIAPLMNWMITIYLIISTVLAIFAIVILPKIWSQVAQWFAIIAINSVIAIVQQARAQTKLESLQRLTAPTTKVIRDGKIKVIPSDQVVIGDVIKVEQGDRVPADARIIKAYGLKVNEANLTGESTDVEKFEEGHPLPPGTSIGELKNMIFMGSYVTAGSATAVVTAVGKNTELGKISRNLEEIGPRDIPLRQKVNKIAKYLGIAVVIYLSIAIPYDILVLHTTGLLYTSEGIDITHLVEEVVSKLITAMSIMPINIPLLTTIILVTGVLAMAKHNVIIRDLNAVESLGRVSVVCTDKTGTITKNQMTVKWVWTPEPPDGTLYGVSGVGFEPNGDILHIDLSHFNEIREAIVKEPEIISKGIVYVKPGSPLEYLLICGLLNNDSIILKEKEKRKNTEIIVYKAVGDTTDAALLVLFKKSKLDQSVYEKRFQLVRSYPFDSRLKRMSKVFKEGNQYFVFSKGATEVMLPRCSQIISNNVDTPNPFTEDKKKEILSLVNIFAAEGFRVISLAYKKMDALPPKSPDERDIVENDLVYLGFVAIIDPPREGVRDSVVEAKGAGIKPVMITGDSLETALSVAKQVNIADDDDLAVEGEKIEKLPDQDFVRTAVFARVSPEHKKIIVERYKAQNRVVAMTGDGVNDALAISLADVGIAMGITGTEVTKEAADMVIADDSFNSIVVGIREGRGLFQKIRAIIFFYIAVNLAEALIFFGSSFIPGFHLLNNWQHIYIFMTAHSLPPFAIILDKVSKDVMKEKPRDSEEIFNKPLLVELAIYSGILALMFYLVYFGTLNGLIPFFEENKLGFIPALREISNDWASPVSLVHAKARTMLHTVAFIAECGIVISLRRLNKPIHRILIEDNRWILWPFILLVPLAHLILMYYPETQVILDETIGINLEVIWLTPIDWGIALVCGFLPILAFEAYKIYLLKHGRFI